MPRTIRRIAALAAVPVRSERSLIAPLIRPPLLVALIAALALAALLPAGALAGVAHIVDDDIVYDQTGGDGDNAVLVEDDEPDSGQLLIHDSQASLRGCRGVFVLGVCALDPCFKVISEAGPGVRCPLPRSTSRVRISTEGLADSIQVFVHDVPARIDAGSGNDRVLGGDADDRIEGGSGDDRINGEAGDDLIDGGIGSDTLIGDSLNAGLGKVGFDLVDYRSRTQPIIASLDGVRNDGNADDGKSAGDRDLIDPTVDGILGGSAGDVLRGNAPGNRLDGGPGEDILNGLDGDDRLNPGPGADTVRGQGGNDRLSAADGERDDLSCGFNAPTGAASQPLAESDRATIDLKDLVPTDCETIEQAAVDQHPTVRVRSRAVRLLRAGTVRITLRCPTAVPGGRCRGRLTILRRRGSRKRLGASAYALRAGQTNTVTVDLSRAKRAFLRRRTLPVRIVAAELDTHGRPKTTIQEATVRATKRDR